MEAAMQVRMTRSYEHKLEGGRRRRIPAGWVGDLDKEIAGAAIKDGAAVALSKADTQPKAAKKAD
jgi:hypothetical protein